MSSNIECPECGSLDFEYKRHDYYTSDYIFACAECNHEICIHEDPEEADN